MKKALTAAITLAGSLGYAGAANAVNVNPDGTGEVLLYSYYTVENGNDTFINITNTSNYPKAVKVRLLEAMNSQEVLDFNLYLSEEDVWTAGITRTTNGAKIFTTDNSCTVPKVTAAGVEFRNFEYEGTNYDDSEGGPQGLDRTRTGYVEVIEMGIIGDVDYPIPGTVPQAYFNIHDMVTHGANGVPLSCAALSTFWGPAGVASSLWTNNTPWQSGIGSFGLGGASGGLYGSASIVNVEGGTDVSYDATSIDNFWSDYIPHHSAPGDLAPSLNSTSAFTAYLPNGDVFISDQGSQPVDVVSAVLMKTALMNDYLTVDILNAQTDWVVTFPTKRFYVNGWEDSNSGSYSGDYPYGYQDDDDGDGKPDDRTILESSNGPFTTWWTDAKVGDVAGSACEEVSFEYYDQEEQTPRETFNIDFSPQPPGQQVGQYICYEANVISINGSDILGSPYTRSELNLAPGWDAGWIRLHMGTASGADNGEPYLDADNGEMYGLPAIGFAVTAFVNGDVGGLLSNYAGLTNHKAETSWSLYSVN